MVSIFCLLCLYYCCAVAVYARTLILVNLTSNVLWAITRHPEDGFGRRIHKNHRLDLSTSRIWTTARNMTKRKRWKQTDKHYLNNSLYQSLGIVWPCNAWIINKTIWKWVILSVWSSYAAAVSINVPRADEPCSTSVATQTQSILFRLRPRIQTWILLTRTTVIGSSTEVQSSREFLKFYDSTTCSWQCISLALRNCLFPEFALAISSVLFEGLEVSFSRVHLLGV